MGSAPDDILLRLSLVEGFTARHLRTMRRAGASPVLPGACGRPGPAIFRKAEEALTSRKAEEGASRIRDACEAMDVSVIPLGSGEYPGPLAAIPDAPLVLYRIGTGAPLENSVAIVGSRAPTQAGREFAGGLAAGLAASGWTVVSGMARGIDSAAHDGALRGGGRTIAVLGCGVDVVYPPEAGRLRGRILERGALLAEVPPGTPPRPRNFPARNRIISGIARGVVVAEAPVRSGSLITARFALDQGKEVLAVPGNPLFPHTAGNNRLIREGAPPVTSVEDVIESLGWKIPPLRAESREGKILRFLAHPRRVDEISAALCIPAPELLPLLLEMEMGKMLERAAGDYYKRGPLAGD